MSYDGTSYCGWQIQPDAPSIQEHVETALSTLFKNPISVNASSRTDSGVHALEQTVSFTPPLNAPSIPMPALIRALNSRLPPSIRILSVNADDIHARFDAVGKAYTYLIHHGAFRSPFLFNYCWTIREPLENDRLQEAAKQLCGRHDFSAFSVKSGQEDIYPICHIERIQVNLLGVFNLITVIGDHFLYRMVRRLVGFLTEVGHKRLQPESASIFLKTKNHTFPFNTVPSRGLYLDRVFFTEEEMKSYCPPNELPFLRFLNEQTNLIS